MNIFEAFVLGIIQGATEFLPVSSSGHSVLIPALFGLSQPTLGMSIVAHLGTWLAVVIYFARDLWSLLTGTFTSVKERQLMAYPESRLVGYIIISSIPAAIAGYIFNDWFEALFTNARWAAFFLIGTAVVLIIGEKLLSGEKQLAEMSWQDALVIGLFQMVALFPGLSRSGSTIMAGLIRGLNRELAARYSFLISVPIIFGAGLVEMPELINRGFVVSPSILLTIFMTSAVVGYLCIHFLMSWLRRRSLYPFAIYCATFGLLFLLFYRV